MTLMYNSRCCEGMNAKLTAWASGQSFKLFLMVGSSFSCKTQPLSDSDIEHLLYYYHELHLEGHCLDNDKKYAYTCTVHAPASQSRVVLPVWLGPQPEVGDP